MSVRTVFLPREGQWEQVLHSHIDQLASIGHNNNTYPWVIIGQHLSAPAAWCDHSTPEPTHGHNSLHRSNPFCAGRGESNNLSTRAASEVIEIHSRPNTAVGAADRAPNGVDAWLSRP